MKTYDELLAECDALAAKLQKIDDAWMAAGCWPTTVEEKQALANAINAAPQQCLAEIRADAIEAFCKSTDALAINQAPTDRDCSEDLVIGWKAGNVDCRMAGMKYAAKVRQGGE